jgi:hypothetical protein
MPVTARLSKAFYDRFGEQVTNELVDWFNDVDETYRNSLRELNELNFARFDAKLEQRFAQQDAKWERRFAELDAKWEKRFAELDAKIDRVFSGLRGELRAEIAASESRLLRWMFVFWTGNLAATAGIVFAVIRLGR